MSENAPFPPIFTGCERHVGKGVRFNASKDKAGKYFSTTIWAFGMQCPSCTQKFVVKTDPAKSDYDLFSGLRRKIESYDEDEATGARALCDTEHGLQEQALNKKADCFASLERQGDDKALARDRREQLVPALDRAAALWEDDVLANRLLRKRHRAERNDIKSRDRQAASLGLALELLPPSPADARAATNVRFAAKRRAPDHDRPALRARIAASSIFGARSRSGRDAESHKANALAASRGIDVARLRLHQAPRPKSTSTLAKRALNAARRA